MGAGAAGFLYPLVPAFVGLFAVLHSCLCVGLVRLVAPSVLAALMSAAFSPPRLVGYLAVACHRFIPTHAVDAAPIGLLDCACAVV